METLNPNNDTENRNSVGGKKRSSRRSSILKTAKSPMKIALEDIDPNSLGNEKETRDNKSNRRSSGRRVSFAQTYQVKEFCKDEEWNAIWEKENSITSDQAEQPDLLRSEYRQPTDTIKGLESLLKGDIQNTGQDMPDGDEPSMDFTFCGNTVEQSGRQAFQPLEGYVQDHKHHYENEMDALELTCHGQGLIKQDDRTGTNALHSQHQSTVPRKETITRRSGVPGYVQHSQYYQQADIQVEKARDFFSNKENDGMDFTVCQGPGRYDVQMSSQATFSNDRTVMFDPNSGDVPFHSMELTCHGQGLASHQTTSTKINPSSFLQSLGQKSNQPKESYHQSLSAHHQQKVKVAEKPNARSFLASLSESEDGSFKELAPNRETESSHARSNGNLLTVAELPDTTEPDEDMEMTACMDLVQTDMKTAVNPNATVQDGMDFTTVVPAASRLQTNVSAVHEAQMDMTTCVPPTPRLQDNPSAVSEAQMDMTTCVPPTPRLQDNPSAVSEAQMDMTTCVPPTPRLQDNPSTVSEAQMDMTTCVPPTPRLQDNPLTLSEAQMDMTTCVPPAPRPQDNPSAVSEAHMDMTTCVPPTPRLQDNPSTVSEAQMDMTTCVPPTPRLQDNPLTVSEAQMDMTTCVPPAPRPQDNPSAVSEAHMDMTTCVPPTPRLQDNPSTVSEAQMDMTTCVPPTPRLQDNPLTVSEAQMDMTTCVPPAPRPQDNPSAVSEAHMDMTTCVPPAPRLQDNPSAMSEAQMDMTTCVPPTPRLQDNPSAVSEAQMDMTTCVPPTPRLQDNPSTVSEAQMDMTTCVPPAPRLQDNPSAVSEAQMDMTTCAPPTPRLQDNPSAVSEAQMDMTTCAPPTPRLQDNPAAVSEAQMDMTTCVPPAPRLQDNPSAVSQAQMEYVPAAPFLTVDRDGDHSIYRRSKEEQEGTTMAHGNGQLEAQDESHVSGSPEKDSSLMLQTDSRKRQNSSSIDSTIQSEISTGKKKQLDSHQDHPQNTSEVSSSLGPVSTGNNKVGSSIQSWLNRSMPVLDRKKTQPTFLKSLPSLSRSLLEFDGPGNKTIPHTTFAPVSNVPISKFCAQPVTKRKMIQIDHHEIPASQDEQTGSSAVNQKDNKLEDSFTPDNDIETEQSFDQDMPQDDDDDGDEEISFKDPPMTRTEEQSVITDLMDEPTLEMDFTEQSALSAGLSTANPTTHQESEGEGEIPKPNGDSTATNAEHFMEPKATNLSTIREEHDINSSKLADRTLPTGKQEAPGKQEKMTVAELLSRANISFHFIEQVSRRSTAFIKRAEKPEEEKEFIQLSLFKKPLATSSNDVCTNIQKEVAKLKETMDRQESELNDSNASILQQVDDSKMTEIEIALKELKNICKKCAHRKWIKRTGAMKKKLALTLKENCEVLSNDVRNVNETLLVTRDCLKVIDGIDKEIDEGMENFRKSIEESEMENEELDKLETTLQEKGTNLETREGELREMEDQRASFTSTKETLSTEKETLEREQLSLEEMLSQLKNKPCSPETNESFSEKYKWLEGCLEWELTEWNQNHAKFLFLYDTLELRVDFHQSDAAQSCTTQPANNKKIQNISVSSQLADDSHLSARFVHSLVVNYLEKELLHTSNANTRSLSKVLEHVSGLVLAARSLGNELFEMNFNHILTMNGNSICVEFSSVKAFMKFIVQFTIDIWKYPDEIEINIIPKIGKCCAQEIHDTLTSVPAGPKYMTRLVETARQFLHTK